MAGVRVEQGLLGYQPDALRTELLTLSTLGLERIFRCGDQVNLVTPKQVSLLSH